MLFVDDIRGCYVILGSYGDSVCDAVFSFLPPEKVAEATNAVLLLFVTSALAVQAVVTQESPNGIIVLMNFNWEEILTCRPNCI